MPSSRRSPKEWEWACRSAARSSKRMAAACGHRRILLEAASFSSPCRRRPPESCRTRCLTTVPDNEAEATVAVIDDDPDIREALRGLLRSVGLGVELFASVQEFLGNARRDFPGCSGLDLQDELTKANLRLPIIFISGHADVPMSVRAMKAGAVEFLTKPVRDQDLLDAIQLALAKDRARRDDERGVERLRADLDRLTPREREVMMMVVAGRLNKQIA